MIIYKKLNFQQNSINLPALSDLFKRSEHACLLFSNDYPEDAYSAYKLLIGIGAHKAIESTMEAAKSMNDLYAFHAETKDWLMGYLSYNLKNSFENLKSEHKDRIGFSDFYFFQPAVLLKLDYSNSLELSVADNDYLPLADELLHSILSINTINAKSQKQNIVSKMRFSKDQYLQTLKSVQNHIQNGDVYELNLCQEFYADDAVIQPYETYLRLNENSKMPFSSYFKVGDKHLMCASPERYLHKKGQSITSQPIKGTLKRNPDQLSDEEASELLQSNEKERAENIMIVDLVRNDLSRIAKAKSVHVEDLCRVEAYPKLYQMISTVKAELHSSKRWVDAIQASFPMGSMTGAPKIRAMQLIEKYELSNRGLYSGSVGYVSPQADFDFNVVIRSIQYNSTSKYLSFTTGGAITIQSEAESEYQECLLKAQAIVEVLPTAESHRGD